MSLQQLQTLHGVITQVPLETTGVLYKSGTPPTTKELEIQTADMKAKTIFKVVLLLEKNDIAANYLDKGIQVLHFPIPDGAIPPSKTTFLKMLNEIQSDLDQGKNIVVQDLYGIGRSGLVIACLANKRFKHPTSQETETWLKTNVPTIKLSPLQQTCLQQLNSPEDNWVAPQILPPPQLLVNLIKVLSQAATPPEDVTFTGLPLESKREECLSHLIQNIKLLRDNVNDIATLNAAGQILIGLSQHTNFDIRVLKDFQGLEDYLGNESYKYVPDNVYKTTAKPCKAAIFNLIKGFKQTNQQVCAQAKLVFKHLVTDFLSLGQKDPQAEKMKQALYCLSIGYFNASQNKFETYKELTGIWNNSTDHLMQIHLLAFAIGIKLEDIHAGSK